jgi:hypothetical protein
MAPPPPVLGGAAIVTCADDERVVSATETADIVTVAGEGTVAGGV